MVERPRPRWAHPSPRGAGHRAWAERYPAPKWRGILGLGFRLSGDLDRLHEAMRTGRPFGGKHFVAELESTMERNLEPQKRVGKPKPATLAASAFAPPTDHLPDGTEKGYAEIEFLIRLVAILLTKNTETW